MEFLVTPFHQKEKKASAVLLDCKWTEMSPVTEKINQYSS
jgi:hypothetical protein